MASSAKKRQYDESYIQYGFTAIDKNGCEFPQCVICHKVLSVECMKPRFLKRHLNSCHPNVKSKSTAFFKQKEEGLKRARLDRSGHFSQQNEAGLRASYMVSLRIAQEKKPHNIAEKLIVPCCKDIIRCVIGCNAEQKVTSVPLSNDTVHRRIVDMSDDVKQQVIAEIKGASLGKFALQLDESTDVAACAQLLVFVRYVNGEDFKEDFLFCHTLDSTTRGEDIFNEVSNFFEREGLSWNNVCACTTDGAPAMLGRRSGFRGKVTEANPKTRHLHCMLHRYALASKTLPPGLRSVLDDVVSMVNTIKSSALNTRLFSLMCQELGNDHEVLLFHTEVRWLSRGNVVTRVESLKEELTEFFKRDSKTKSREFIQKLSDSQWLQKLAYLTDIFLRLNSLNLSLQGRFATVIDFMDKLRSFTMKLELWERKVKDGNLSMFENLDEALGKNKNAGNVDVMQLVQAHLASLRMELQSYFPELSELESKLIRNPFIVNVHLLPDNMQEEFLELVNDSAAKDAFETLTLTKFWSKMSEIYPVVSDVVLNSLLMFPSTYLCEQGFSTLLNMKTKYRSRLNMEHDLRVCLSNVAPRIEKLVCNKQAQPSH